MSNVKILIVEDDVNYALELEMLVKELEYDLMGIVKDAKGAFDILKKDTPDLVLMDIHIEGEINGIELAQKIQEEKIGIIFITSFNDKETFNKARKAKNFGYIIKPFNHLTLEGAIEVALMSLDKDDEELTEIQEKKSWDADIILKDFIFIKKRTRLEKVALDDIRYIEADGNYCMIETTHRKYVLKLSLVKVADILSDNAFIRISKGRLVNLKKVSSIEISSNKVFLEDLEFPIGKAYKENVLGKLRMIT